VHRHAGFACHLAQVVQVTAAVVVVQEDRALVVAALDDVVRMSGQEETLGRAMAPV
jgi:hypothetical protein